MVRYLKVAMPVPLWQVFDYAWPSDTLKAHTIQPGVRVKAPFGRRELVGVVLSVAERTDIPLDKIKSAIAILDETPILSPGLLKLCDFASRYYHHPIGEVIKGVLPKLLRQGKPLRANHLFENDTSLHQNEVLNQEQNEAVSAILSQKSFQVSLLDGVTGSGKTEVYMCCIEKVVQQNKQALVLVPEIGLTPQTVKRFCERFDFPVCVIHSNLTPKERLSSWVNAYTGKARIIIGTRSAVFTPMPDLGMLVVDEEHDGSYKQDAGFRYSARDLAVIRGKFENIPVILGSATPSLESLHNANQCRYQHLRLNKRVNHAVFPKIEILDCRQHKLHNGMSEALVKEIDVHVREGNQVLLFLNRRGFAPTMYCHHCGEIVHCARCDARMTYHQSLSCLYCHHCGKSQRVPEICPACRQANLLALGQGTERLEFALKERYASSTILRIDRDTTRSKKSMEEKLKRIHDLDARILIGTQMVAKGHHFPRLTLSVIIDLDVGLLSADFRALERMGQLFVQVAGRSGREKKPGKVIIQTRYPTHPLLQLLFNQGYSAFSSALLKERQDTYLPPYVYFVLLRAESSDRSKANAFLSATKEIFTKISSPVKLYGPMPALMEKKAGRFRSHLLLQSLNRHDTQSLIMQSIPGIQALPLARHVRWSIDVDPQEPL